jgi:hypothetical protein
MSVNKYSPAETARLREQLLRDEIAPIIQRAFAAHPALNSATLLVAQYWCDEAEDAVHYDLVFSEKSTPDTAAAYAARIRRDEIEFGESTPPRTGPPPVWEKWFPWLRASSPPAAVEGDPINLPSGIDEQVLEKDFTWNLPWDSNGEPISLFAAYCLEDCHQEMDVGEAYSPYAVFRRQGSEVVVEVTGVMTRPWLDGVKPKDGEEE